MSRTRLRPTSAWACELLCAPAVADARVSDLSILLRDWAADLGLMLFAVCFAAVSSQSVPVAGNIGPVWRAVDQAGGGLGCAVVLLRRRWPVPLAVVLLLAGAQTHYVTGP